MLDNIITYINSLFKGKMSNQAIIELKEELISNLQEMYLDSVSQGMTPEEAYQKVTQSVGNIDDLISETCPPPTPDPPKIVLEKIFLVLCFLAEYSIFMTSTASIFTNLISDYFAATIMYSLFGMTGIVLVILGIISVVRKTGTDLLSYQQVQLWKKYDFKKHNSYKWCIYSCWGIIFIVYLSLSFYSGHFGNLTILFPIGFILHKFTRICFQKADLKLVWMVLLLVLSVILMRNVIVSNAENSIVVSTHTMELKNESVDLSNIEEIKFNCYTEDLNIHFVDSLTTLDLVETSAQYPSADRLYSLSQDGTTLTVNGETEATYENNNFLSLSISIPSSFSGKVFFYTSAGNVTVDGAATLTDFILHQESGTLKFDGTISAKTCEIINLYGHMSIQALTSENYILKNDSGDIEVNSLSGAGQISNVNGKIKINYAELTGDSSIQASTNDVNVTFAKSFSGELLINHTFGKLSGNICTEESENNSNICKIGNTSDSTLEITAVSGNVTIQQ